MLSKDTPEKIVVEHGMPDNRASNLGKGQMSAVYGSLSLLTITVNQAEVEIMCIIIEPLRTM